MAMSFGEMSPSRCHHWDSFFAHLEVMGLLVVFDITGLKHGSSAFRIVSKLAHSCGFEIGWIESELVVGSYLIKGILIAHVFISGEV